MFGYLKLKQKSFLKKKQKILKYVVTSALFVLALTFSEKLFIFQKTFFLKLSYFLVFDNNRKKERKNIF